MGQAHAEDGSPSTPDRIGMSQQEKFPCKRFNVGAAWQVQASFSPH